MNTCRVWRSSLDCGFCQSRKKHPDSTISKHRGLALLKCNVMVLLLANEGIYSQDFITERTFGNSYKLNFNNKTQRAAWGETLAFFFFLTDTQVVFHSRTNNNPWHSPHVLPATVSSSPLVLSCLLFASYSQVKRLTSAAQPLNPLGFSLSAQRAGHLLYLILPL